MMEFSKEKLTPVAALWGIELKTIGDGSLVAGSPERTAFRALIESAVGEFFVLEKIHRRDAQQKDRIARTLEYLSRRGLKTILPYKK
ncbi:MAG TPA: hypothetical protein PKV41_06010, partial [Candidatus Omnitrophota bacterium]|nr:hypothetical protein [Candidatus Omnitrophota bacterium]